jgi:hypothetical protein
LSDKIVTMKYSQRNENLDFWFREAKWKDIDIRKDGNDGDILC